RRSSAEAGRNRRGHVGVFGAVGLTLEALLDAVASPAQPDLAWRQELIAENRTRVEALAERLAVFEPGSDGLMHPNAVFTVLNELIDDQTIVVVDGGDTLAFARVALRPPTYPDLGPF